MRAVDMEQIQIRGQFDNEPWHESTFYALEGDPPTVLRSVTDRLWEEYVYRQGHATSRHVPSAAVMCHGRYGTDAYTLDDGWRNYRVYHANDETKTSLDLDKTLAELGLTVRKHWLRFERVI